MARLQDGQEYLFISEGTNGALWKFDLRKEVAVEANRAADPVFAFTFCRKLDCVIAADSTVRLLKGSGFYEPFDHDALLAQGLIKTKGKSPQPPVVIDEQESDVTCLKIDRDEEYIAAGLSSGTIILYKSELLFGQFSLIEFTQHEKEVNDMYFLKKENINLLIAACSDTKLSVISLDEMCFIFFLDLGKYPLRNITLVHGRDQILVNTSHTNEMHKIYFNWFDIPKKNRDR